jgi:hypothetical protein
MATSAKQIGKFAAESAFVFIGKLVKPRAATMPGLSGEDTAIVHVVRVISGPPMFASLAGQDVTVRFKKPVRLRTGSSLTYFANGRIFGRSVAVDVVGTAEETDSATVAGAARSGVIASQDRVLSARLASSAISVAGTVARVTKSDKGTTHISEHDPDWREATINVDEVIKGKKGVKQVKVLFPGSDDVRWHKVNKYAVGQKGVWMLQPGVKQDRAGIQSKIMAAVPTGPGVLTTLHAADYLPLHELERVRALANK